MQRNIAFRPRRLAHANLWVSNIEQSIAFYESVLGIELVRRERALKMGFHSNGNTHHDIGMIEISRGVDRYGRDGNIQIPKTAGTAVRLNHLGWEMESERDVADAYARAKALGDAKFRTADHLISHSVYVPDPDGNMHEFYADAVDDWRTIFNLELEDEVTAAWDPLGAPPSDAHRYPVNPPIRSVPQSPLRPIRITRATLGTHDLDRMVDFFRDVAGLTLQDKADGQARFGGAAGGKDLILVETPESGKTGLQKFSFVVTADCDLATAGKALGAKGVAARFADTADGPSLTVTDPDGFQIELLSPANAGAAH
jgi:catechol 2,3-dioxygenase